MPEIIIDDCTPETPEELKSFDVLSSVRLYQFDLANFGYILPETRQRVYDEELSYIAEGLDRQNYTEFDLRFENEDLAIFHDGQWKPYLSTLKKGLRAAEHEAAADSRKAFEIQRRADDLQRGRRMLSLKPGEKIHWYYDFPKEQQDCHGAELLESMGYQPARKLGYLCEAEKNADGSVTIRQQSVDNSNNDAFEMAMREAEAGGSIENMRTIYDNVLEQEHRANFYAGRRLDQKASLDNAWVLVTRNKDLIEDYFLAGIEQLATLDLRPAEMEAAKKRLTYGVWASLKERIDEQAAGVFYDGGGYGGSIQAQVELAYAAASARSEVLFGCGGTITGKEAIIQASSKDVFRMIFEDTGEKKWFGCPYCGAKQFGDPCAVHLYCADCTAEVKNGKVLSTGRRQIKKGFFEVIAEEFTRWNQQNKIGQSKKRAERDKSFIGRGPG